MSLPNFYVRFLLSSGYWTLPSNLLELSLSAGRMSALDTFDPTTGSMLIRRDSSINTKLNEIVPGTTFDLAGGSPAGIGGGIFVLTVTDVVYQWAMTSTIDTVLVTFEGELAKANRSYLNNYNLSGNPFVTQVNEIETQSGVTLIPATNNNPQIDGTTVTSVADWLQKLATTVNGRLDDTAGVTVYDRYTYEQYTDIVSSKNIVFTDGSIALTGTQIGLSYEQIEMATLGENYYTRTIVDPDNHSAQVATLSTASAPYRVLQLNTYNSSTAQAQDYANFLLSTYSDPAHQRVSSVTVNGASTNGDLAFKNLGGLAINKTVVVNFRGTVYNAVIEGFSYTATPDIDMTTYYFSGADLNNYLILNDTDRGVLDANRLGY